MLGPQDPQRTATYEVRGAVTGTLTYGGIRDLRDSRDHTLRWIDLSTRGNYPHGGAPGFACGVSINDFNPQQGIKIDVLTTTGRVFEIICVEDNQTDNNPAILICPASWAELHPPTPGANNSWHPTRTRSEPPPGREGARPHRGSS
ncbi:hypothetical protein [Streptomyces sp. NPDC002671]